MADSQKKRDEAEEMPLKNVTKQVKEMTFIEKIKFFKSNITVEPALALFMIPSVIRMLANQNLIIEKACIVNLNFTDEVCTALRKREIEDYKFEEKQVQKLVASTLAWKGVITTVVPTLLMLFLGAWSDKTGRRKICMLLPILGELMMCIANISSTFFFYEVPMEWTVLLEIIFPALTGGWNTMLLGTFSYLGDVTSKETRTFRMGILNLCMTIGFPIGAGISGVLVKYTGFYGVFSIAASLQFINFCYVVYYIKDHTRVDRKEKIKSSACARVMRFLKDFFHFRSLKDTMKIVLKKGPNNRRLRICLILLVACLTFGPLWGELGIVYIFTRYQFGWDEVKYSIFTTYSLVAHSFGILFAISVFSKKLGVDDAVLGMLSTTSKICGAIVHAFARTDYEIYMAPLLEMVNGTATIALRSIASKLVSYQELGKVYSLFGLVETMVPLIFNPLYSRIYIATLNVLPGAVFLVSVAATMISFGIFVWFYQQHKKDRKQLRQNVGIPSATVIENEHKIAPAEIA